MEEEIRAVRFLTSWLKSTRKLVALTKQDYDELLPGVRPVIVAHDSEGEVEYVSVYRMQAIKFLENEHNLRRRTGC